MTLEDIEPSNNKADYDRIKNPTPPAHYTHADCDRAIIEERLDDACEDCRNHMFKPLTPPAQPEDAARPQKPALNEIARIVNSHFLQTPYKGKDWEAVRKEIIEELCAHEYLKAQEELDEILDMATSNYNNTGNEDMRALANYCSNRIIQLREHPQPTQPPAADTTKQGVVQIETPLSKVTKQGEGESDE